MRNGLIVNFSTIDGTIQLAPQAIQQGGTIAFPFNICIQIMLKIAGKAMEPSFFLVFLMLFECIHAKLSVGDFFRKLTRRGYGESHGLCHQINFAKIRILFYINIFLYNTTYYLLLFQ